MGRPARRVILFFKELGTPDLNLIKQGEQGKRDAIAELFRRSL
jgi:hypothetical protein